MHKQREFFSLPSLDEISKFWCQGSSDRQVALSADHDRNVIGLYDLPSMWQQ